MSAKNKGMKTCGAITAEGTAQKYMFSTRYIKVTFENSLTELFGIWH